MYKVLHDTNNVTDSDSGWHCVSADHSHPGLLPNVGSDSDTDTVASRGNQVQNCC